MKLKLGHACRCGVRCFKYPTLFRVFFLFLFFFLGGGDAATYGENFDGTTFISVCNTVVVDICAASTHRNVGGRALSNFLQSLGVDYVYTPSYSPDMNVAEFVFGKLKKLMQMEQCAGKVRKI